MLLLLRGKLSETHMQPPTRAKPEDELKEPFIGPGNEGCGAEIWGFASFSSELRLSALGFRVSGKSSC